MTGVVIPRTEFTDPTFGCGHPKWGTNITTFGQCKFCSRVQHMNANAAETARRAERRERTGALMTGERVLRYG